MARTYYFKKTFSSRFILDAETVKDIHHVLDLFLEKENLDLPIEYHVFTSNEDSYVTSEVEQVISEPNSKQNRISYLIIRIGQERLSVEQVRQPLFIECRFFPPHTILSPSCKVEIQDYRSGKSQHQLAKDLTRLFEKTQREATLATLKIPAWLTGALPPNATFLAILLLLRTHPHLSTLKLGDLGVLDVPFYLAAFVFLYGACFVVWKAVELPKMMEKRFRTVGIFLWGAETFDYRNRVSLNERITWGVIVALIIGTAGSLIAAALTSI
jgi:hypothetical protein